MFWGGRSKNATLLWSVFLYFYKGWSWGILPLNHIAGECKCLAALANIPGTTTKSLKPNHTLCSEVVGQKMLPCYEVCFFYFYMKWSWGILPLNHIAGECKCLAALANIPGTTTKSLKPNHTLCSEATGQKMLPCYEVCFFYFYKGWSLGDLATQPHCRWVQVPCRISKHTRHHNQVVKTKPYAMFWGNRPKNATLLWSVFFLLLYEMILGDLAIQPHCKWMQVPCRISTHTRHHKQAVKTKPYAMFWGGRPRNATLLWKLCV